MKNIDKIVNRPISPEESSLYDIILQLMKLRNKNGYSQNQLASAIHVAHTSIARIENFKMQPTLKMVLQILNVYDMTLIIAPNKKSTNSVASRSSLKSYTRKLPVASGGTDSNSIKLDVWREIIIEINKIKLCVDKEDDYAAFVDCIFAQYCKILTTHQVKKSIIESVDRMGKYLHLVLAEYYSGQHDLSYALFKECIQSYVDLDVFLKELPSDMVLYRCRKKEPGISYTDKDMFHIPFSKRYAISTQRYSYPGLPCLYLGSSPKVCAVELSCPENELVTATIKYHKNNTRYRIIDLTSVFDKSTILPQDDYIDKLLRNIPLTLICSTTINYGIDNNHKVGFKQEYIFPQLLLEYILNETILDKDIILGIKYYSSKIDFISSWITGDCDTLKNMCNYVFPAREMKKGSKYCYILQDSFKVDSIENQN